MAWAFEQEPNRPTFIGSADTFHSVENATYFLAFQITHPAKKSARFQHPALQ